MKTIELYDLFLQYPKICIDSRKAISGSLFFALKGDNFDGNVFAQKALEKCNYAVVDDPKVACDERFILVDNVLEKLQKMAAIHRKRLGIPILALTGSNGKTTTKELIVAVMQKRFKVGYTKGNYNNHIGVPLTLLSFTKDLDFGVVEMGANHLGEIALLSKITAPDYGLITNVGKAHLEGFGSFDGVKKAKGELYEYLYHNYGTAFINYDNEHLEDMNPPHSAIYYGTKGFTHCQGRLEKGNLFMSFRWIDSDDTVKEEINWERDGKLIKTQLFGDYNFENALAAVCIGNNFNIGAALIKEAIESYIPDNNRSQLIQTSDNKIIMDAYNANPTSMKLSIENFAKIEGVQKVVILGDMFELGSAAIREHGVVVGLLDDLKFDNVFLLGPIFGNYNDHKKFNFFENVTEFQEFLKTNPLKGKIIMLKGSRGMKLERILELL